MFLKNGKVTCAHTLQQIHHNLLMDFSEQSMFEGTDRRFAKVHLELPHPVHKPLKVCADKVKELLDSKQEYKKLLEGKRKEFKNDKRDIFEEKNGCGDSIVHIPRHLLDFFMINNNDPDVDFNSDYNFYYTGGVLEYMEIYNGKYLLRPDAENNLRLLDLSNNQDSCFDWTADSTIFGISSPKVFSKNLLLVREKHHLNILEISDELDINSKMSFESKKSIFDAKYTYRQSHIGIAFSNSSFQVRDIENRKTVYTFKNLCSSKFNGDNFQQFEIKNEDQLFLLNRCEVKLLDIRERNAVQSLEPGVINCNSLCALKMHGSDLFLVSRHYVMKTDIRYLKNISHYTHSLISPPCYMDFATKDEDTYFCLSSQKNEEKVLFTGYSPYSLPYKVPNIKATLKECCLNYPGVILREDLDDRLDFSISGVKILNEHGKINIYSTNCLGEVFKQQVSDSEIDSKTCVNCLWGWINDLEKPEPYLHLTNVEEASDIRFMLNFPINEEDLSNYKDKGKADQFLAEYSKQYGRENAKGALSKDFLSIWYDDEDESSDDVDTLPEIPVEDKVSSWIQTNEFLDGDNNFSFISWPGNSQ